VLAARHGQPLTLNIPLNSDLALLDLSMFDPEPRQEV
jgi:hypothetical protein